MAGEWLKIDCAIDRKPEVLTVATMVGCPEELVIGRLVRLWAWAVHVTEDGTVAMPPERLERVAGGDVEFWQAVESVGWIQIEGDQITIPGWEDRFSQSAKARALQNRRVAKHREAKKPRKKGKNESCNGRPLQVCESGNGDALQGGNGRPLQVSKSGNGGAYTRGEERRREENKPAAPVATSVPRSRPPSPKISWSSSEGWAGITAEDRAGWAEAYPAVDLTRALAAMTEWLRANPTKARKSNWRAFVTRWLTREQDRGGDAQSNRPGATVTPKENRRYFRSDAHKSLTDAEYEAWKAEQGSQRQITQGKANGRQNASQGPTGAGGQTSRVSEFGRKLATDLVEEF